MFFLRFSTFSPFFAVKLTFFSTFISVSGNLVITVNVNVSNVRKIATVRTGPDGRSGEKNEKGDV
jgi:hypothetical protein